MTRADVVLGFSDSAEHRSNTMAAVTGYPGHWGVDAYP